MPTSHDRTLVTKDPALAEALDRAGVIAKPGIASATLVRDLAIRGAQALLADRQRDAEAIERLVKRTTAQDPGYDPEVLTDIDRLGWERE